MINPFDFYPWIYLYAQLNPKQFPRLRMPNLPWTLLMIRWNPDGLFEYRAVYPTPYVHRPQHHNDPIIAGPLVHRDLSVALQNLQVSSLEAITFRFRF